jgi:putative endonuclease
MAFHNEVGKIGEKIVREFLVKQGFRVVETNFSSFHHGEIDIIAKDKKHITHFIEVKSSSVDSLVKDSKRHIDPRENFNRTKYARLLKTIEHYVILNNIREGEYRLDLACVYVDMKTRQAKVDFLENITL